MKKILIFIGPSGVGKSAIVHELARRGHIRFYPTWTTRPPRDYEKQGALDHVFVSPVDFQRALDQNVFVGTAQPFGLNYQYGLPKIEVNDFQVPSVILRVPMLEQMRAHYTDLLIYQVERNLTLVRSHLADRLRTGTAPRMENHETEIAAGREFAHRVIDNSGTLKQSVEHLRMCLAEDFDLPASEKIHAA
jgi:guanylate kinase